ncbi:exodeoxyribonuclease V subunit beta [Larsenimonas rhizosphaerae]|uniref:exodeoxyribonuclease V subunit beta n=1 Tax=Larsenimonas rhizosphaerae TaxID=2944682 RepID=UPI002033442A|nr:exodeoxyribonuclease V subunit beta [Larsenimonas rhizosphaerae]
MITDSTPSAPSVTNLDIAAFPLFGRRLIEASAGTGKTFTLAALYVRLVLGHGGDNAFARPLMPPEILVVTFTEAATQELRDRIRRRLTEARDALLSSDPITDKVLALLLEPYTPEERRHAAARLDQAARMMDDAAIFTIHGFCQRMLKRHAFDSGSLFASTLVQDIAPLYQQVVDDYWRQQFYGLSVEAQAVIGRLWSGPDALGQAVRPLVMDGRPMPLYWDNALIESPESVEQALSAVLAFDAALAAQKAALQQLWSREQVAITHCLSEAVEQKRLNARSFRLEDLQEKWSLLEQWLSSPSLTFPSALRDSKKQPFCGRTRIRDAVKKGHDAPEHAFFAQLEDWVDLGDHPEDPTPGLMAHARDHICQALLREKRRQAQWTFDDLLNELDDALAGPAGSRLAGRIRDELPVALIDEFQDTDPVQYRIFSTIYPVTRQDQALLLIGDPKQAIYSFRGADIETYLAARRSADSHHTLERNFRSTSAMVDAVNRLFKARVNPFSSEEIPFQAVTANGLDTRLEAQGVTLPAMGFWWPETSHSVSVSDYTRLMSQALVNDIRCLLDSGRAGLAGFRRDEHTPLTPIRPADIAILVRTGREADLVRQALDAQGIKSVYLSQKRSVFESATAFQVLQVLEAASNPRDDRRLRAALATRLLSDDLSVVASLSEDEMAWETMIERFDGYHRRWQRDGVLPMLRTVMQDFDIGVRCLSWPDGERQLTDLLHLGELAQMASQFLEGEQALMRWLHRSLSGHVEQGMSSDALVQRLESDEALVRVITLHKAKGLQYPVVYLPFIANYREIKDTAGPVVLSDPELGRFQAWHLSPEQRTSADRQRLEEDMRLLYVGLTRAQYACRLGLAPVFKGRKGRQHPEDATSLDRSAIGWLLEERGDITRGTAVLSALRGLDAPDISACLALPEPIQSAPVASGPATETGAARLFTGRVDRRYAVSSYSQLMRRTQVAPTDDEAPMQGVDVEVVDERTPLPLPPGDTLLDFPRGPGPGTFLHALLDQVDWPRLGEEEHDSSLRVWLEHRLLQGGMEARWGPVLIDVARRLASRRLAAPEVTLAGLDRWKVEVEFWVPVHGVNVASLDQAIRQMDPIATRRPALGAWQLSGMVKGFIDLLAEKDDCWYIIDWKSNHLGDRLEDYRAEAMEAAVAEHRYDVQYWLYALAVHRLLRSRVPGYDPARHFGGVRYLFLRGFAGEVADEALGIWARTPTAEQLSRLDALFEQPISDIDRSEVAHGA